MKRIFALISLFIVSLINNIEPVQVDDVSFTNNSYYVGDVHTETDYQKLYKEYIGESSTNTNGCCTTPISAGTLRGRPCSDTGRYWFIFENTSAIKDLYSEEKGEVSMKANGCQTIIAPAKAKISSSSNKSRQGTRMTIEFIGGMYRITFDKMSRWYCCKDRKPSLLENPIATFEHTKDAKGQVIGQGDILGYTTSDTTVQIEELIDGEYVNISTKEFFNGTSN